MGIVLAFCKNSAELWHSTELKKFDAEQIFFTCFLGHVFDFTCFSGKISAELWRSAGLKKFDVEPGFDVELGGTL